jgi:phosphoglycerate dehydrogenase-like enzyme
VHSRSAGLDNVLFPELVESEVPLTNGSGVFSQSLGEFVLGAILYFAKDFRRMIRNQVAGKWSEFDITEISGQTVGIEYAHQSAQLAQQFMRQIVNSVRA